MSFTSVSYEMSTKYSTSMYLRPSKSSIYPKFKRRLLQESIHLMDQEIIVVLCNRRSVFLFCRHIINS